MPLMNSMGALKEQRSLGPLKSNYMYMYNGFTGTSYPSQNDIIVGAYDIVAKKFFTANANNDFITCFNDYGNIPFNTSRPSTYAYYAVAANNNGLFTSNTSVAKVDFNNYNYTLYSGQLSGQILYKYLYDSSGNIISLSNLTIGSTNYLLVGKFSPTGTIIWQTRFTIPTPTVNYISLNDVCIDSSNNIYYCGELPGAATPTSIWGKINSNGTLGYTNTQTNIQMVGVKCIGSNLYFAMNNGSNFTTDYYWDASNTFSTISPYVGIADATTGAFTKISQLQKSTANTYRLTGISVDTTDSNNIFVYGYNSAYSASGDVQSIIFKLDSGLTTLKSKRKISFTVDTTAHPTYTHNETFINNLQYQASFNSFYIAGTTLDFLTPYTNPYYNNFMFRAKVDIDYTGTILNRTYTIGNLADTVSVNNIATFSGTSFASVSFTPAYTMSTSSTTLTSSATYPTKVLL